MKDPVLAIIISISVFLTGTLLIIEISDLVAIHNKYNAYVAAHAKVLACRSSNTTQPDRICGPIPTLKDFDLFLR